MKIDHVAMYVQDLERTRDFFIRYFDARSNELYHNKNTNFRSYFLSFEDGSRLEIMNIPELPQSATPIQHPGFIHIAFSVGSKENVDALTTRLESDGYRIHSGPRTTGDGYYESCIVDFEGNLIEITI